MTFNFRSHKYSKTLYISVPYFDPTFSTLVSKPPTAKCASIGAKNSTRATTVESSSRYSLGYLGKRIQDAGEAGNTCNDNRFPSSSSFQDRVRFRRKLPLPPFPPKRPLCYRATFFESSNFVRIDLSPGEYSGCNFVECNLHATHVHLTCKLLTCTYMHIYIYYVFKRKLNQSLP